ncbi:MAG: 6-bladed beta-propeller [Gemmatimonadaceae bacterium]
MTLRSEWHVLVSTAGRIPLALVLLLAAAPVAAQRADTLRMRLAWEVVEGGHPIADSIGTLTGIALDSRGNVYVSDGSATKIWVLDANGRSQRGIGRKGKGPGEFDHPTGIAIGPDGKLYVRNLSQVARFKADPATGRLTAYDSAFTGPLYADWMNMRATRFHANGNLFHVGTAIMDLKERAMMYQVFSPAGSFVDSVPVPPFANLTVYSARYRVSAGSGRMVRGVSHVPFAPQPAWDITPRGTILLGDGTSYRLREQDRSGRVLREFTRAVTPERIPADERRDSLSALRARLDSIPVPLDRVEGMPAEVRALKLPEVFPANSAAYAAPDGRVWVRRWLKASDVRTVFDVFEADGRYSRVVVLPRIIASFPTPVLSLDGIAAVGIDPETGANTILRFAPR